MIHLTQTVIFSIRMVFFIPETLKAMIKENNDISFSVLCLNTRSSNKNFESRKIYYLKLIFVFKLICIAESWRSDDLHTNKRYQLPSNVTIHQVRKNGKTGSGVTIFIHKDLINNIRYDLGVNDEDTEALCLEIINQISKIFLLILFTDIPLEIMKILKIILVNFSKIQRPR